MNPWPGRLWIAFVMLLALIGGAASGYALNVRFASHTLSVTNLPLGLERFVAPAKSQVAPQGETRVRVTRLTYLQARPDQGPKPVEAPFIESTDEKVAEKPAPTIFSAAPDAPKAKAAVMSTL